MHLNKLYTINTTKLHKKLLTIVYHLFLCDVKHRTVIRKLSANSLLIIYVSLLPGTVLQLIIFMFYNYDGSLVKLKWKWTV